MTDEPTITPEVAAPEAPAAPTPTLDLTEYGSYTVPVKVDGVERFVPVSEAVSGHMMHADYTRKTQELATEREALAEARAIAQALQDDPAGTLKVLSEWYTPEEELADLDPQERAIKEIQDRFAAQDQVAQDAALEAELNSYAEKYGVDQNELLRFAVENNIPNLEWAYAVMDRGRTEAAETLKRETEAAEAARVAAKQGASFVEGGADRASGASAAHVGSPSTIKTVADAFALAKQQLDR